MLNGLNESHFANPEILHNNQSSHIEFENYDLLKDMVLDHL